MTAVNRRPLREVCNSIKAAADLKPASELEPLLRITDLERLLVCDRRSIERLRSAGKFPAPDLRIGRMLRWRRATIEGWISRGGRP